jgi:ubiquinone/menaquinone biosynthesis C-methylase UbiE
VQEPVRILDVASGGADIARAIAGWARDQGRAVAIVASDISYDFLLVARDRSRAYPNLVFVVADARRLPFRDRSVHVATCSLALHHLSPEDGVLMLREMGRCATVGVIVNDIVRSWLGYGGAYVATRLGSRNPLTWHDGPVSVLRAFTAAEMAQLARRAGLRPVHWERFLLYRVAMTAVACGRP